MIVTNNAFVQQLEQRFSCWSVKSNRLGTKRKISRQVIVDLVGADAADQILAAKKILDTSHPAVKKVSAVFSQLSTFKRTHGIPWVNHGQILVQKDRGDDCKDESMFLQQMVLFVQQLDQAKAELQEVYPGSKVKAERDLKLKIKAKNEFGAEVEETRSIYRASDYPERIDELFNISYEPVNILPPPYLLDVRESAFNEALLRLEGKFRETAVGFEQAMLKEFTEQIEYFKTRLGRDEETGDQLTFRPQTVRKFSTMLERFKKLKINEGAELESLIQETVDSLGTTTPQQIQDDSLIRNATNALMSDVLERARSMVADQPRRSFRV